MHTFNTIAKLILFSTAWQLVGASDSIITCDPTWNSVPLGTSEGRTSCQVQNQFFKCKAEDCWTGIRPPKGANHKLDIVFTDCYQYKGEFGKSKQMKNKVTVHAVAYWMLRNKDHINVIGYEGTGAPTPLPGYRCYDVNSPLAQCPSASCTATTVVD